MGRPVFLGGGHLLRESQHYPAAFGTAVSDLYSKYCGDIVDLAAQLPLRVVDVESSSNVAIMGTCYLCESLASLSPLS